MFSPPYKKCIVIVVIMDDTRFATYAVSLEEFKAAMVEYIQKLRELQVDTSDLYWGKSSIVVCPHVWERKQVALRVSVFCKKCKHEETLYYLDEFKISKLKNN